MIKKIYKKLKMKYKKKDKILKQYFEKEKVFIVIEKQT